MQFCPRDSSELVASGEKPRSQEAKEPPLCEVMGLNPTEIVRAPEGRYRILQTLLTIPIGDVCFAEDTFLGRHVTLLLLSPDLPDADKRELFVRYRTMSGIVHPNLSTVYSLENIAGRPAGVV